MPLLSYKTGWLGELQRESFGVDGSPFFCFESPSFGVLAFLRPLCYTT
jgi:hypothetical protein